ncbi:solute carrier family 17 member 9 [Octopus bimaculoides]|uniref:Major facilitator superfamily (MFS) profile domain-containing protein n=2 Tax=Octopus TaxID=6643 RepID=A0A0L8GLD2_OCTBM|nr:solute carrier family 17 member 9 [Octopus bimaculoides]XP_029650026.1 solute carrier family 17 member 9 [Octopus sinensis]|eukprot:XP_014779984.1 PREDICTED: solute carrier family 17 member 9-like [Octopus bimaculoides]
MAQNSKRDDDRICRVLIRADDERLSPGKYWTRQEKRQWGCGLFCGGAMLYACRTVMPLCVVSLAKEFKWNKTESGTVLSSFFWGYTMTQFIGGYLSDRVGGEIVVPMAAAFWSIITFWTPQLVYISKDKQVTLNILVLSRVLLGIFQGFHYPSFTSIISRKVIEQERSLTYSFISSGSYLGTLFTGSLGSLLLDNYGWHSAFYFTGTCGIIWLLLLRYCLISREQDKYVVVSLADNVVAPGKTVPKDYTSVPWLTLSTKLAFWSLIVGHFCQNNAFFVLLSWMPTYFHESFPSAKGWVFNVVPWVVTIPSSIFSGWLADVMICKGYTVTFVRKFMETVALCGSAIFLMLIGYTSSFEASLFCLACAVACCGFHGSGILINPQDIAPKHAGSVFGIMNMAGAIPGFVGVYIAGNILEATKSWGAVFSQTAVVCIFGWIVYMVFGTGKVII